MVMNLACEIDVVLVRGLENDLIHRFQHLASLLRLHPYLGAISELVRGQVHLSEGPLAD